VQVTAVVRDDYRTDQCVERIIASDWLSAAGVSVAASVLTIMALSVERYLAIRHPVMLRRVLTPGRLRSVIVIIWALSVSVMLPLTVVRSVDSYPLLAVGQIITVCHEHWPRTVSF